MTDQPADLWVIIELSLSLAEPPPDDQMHPARTPIGPFNTRQEADDFAEARCLAHGGGSWTVTRLVRPS